MATLKVLAIGAVLGSFKSFFSKVKAFDQKHGKFEMVIATGDFFAPEDDTSKEEELIELLEDKLEVPLQVYIMQGQNAFPKAVIEKVEKTGGTLCNNVFLLGRAGVFSTAHGLKIACLGGAYAPEKFYDKANGADLSNPYFTSASLKQLLNQPALNPSASNPNSLAAMKALTSFQYIDILLTQTWPTSIAADTTTMPPDLQPELAPQLDELVKKAKPRYFFTSGAGRFWEREPFYWPEENNRLTRFVTLGAFGATGTGKKERWYYAFSISTAPPPATPIPPPANATRNPFLADSSEGHKRTFDQTIEQGESGTFGNVEKRFKGADAGKAPPNEKPHEGYVCRICKGTDHFIRDCPQKNPLNADGTRKPREGYVCRACGSDQHYIKDCAVAQAGPKEVVRGRGVQREIRPDECWFCLSNPNLAKHLIVAIGTECYLTLPKGQLPPTQTSDTRGVAPVPGGGHVLIIPVSHYPTFSSIPEDLAPPISAEVEQFKSALRKFYAKYSAQPVSFEVSRLTAKGGHAHVQVIPVPNKFTSEQIENAFRSFGQHTGVEFEVEEETEGTNMRRTENYFRVELPNGRKLIHLMKGSFDLQFGRIALGNLMRLQDRVDWKTCALSDEEEKTDAQEFKKAFAEFDFTQ
ncbi:hypothetical protein M422DRAFT_30418 [Sphaerobolus stellatus SS14]|uniref:CCHC-type domain-containing protein n=1 Tax=Sphaerobolus stellatus (strain SS14) TaxID=990650 RepID=A0A0C9VBC6_SPHS4|nr:hypothetical protein M422DRAFT_30418 [Sphaerobolus stellatus SS14]